jgi:diacylglycerol kinase family enzyme
MRALLVVNPHATTTTVAGRDVLAHALASELKLEVLETTHRGHAAEVAADAVRDGVELVVVHGGDGTVNEVVNGMMDGTGCGPADPDFAPAVAVVPGGSANVFARALGLPRDPMAATAAILHALDEGRSRTVGLGRMIDRDRPGTRWFTFNAGMGWDAEVIAEMERMRARGRRATPLRYAATAWQQYLRQRRDPPSITVELPDTAPLDVRFAFVSNTDTWTYLGSRPVRTNPGASFGTGLGLFGLHDLRTATTFTALREMLRPGGDPRGRNVLRRDTVPLLRMRSADAQALQLDGDHVGRFRDVEFHAVSDALRVVV